MWTSLAHPRSGRSSYFWMRCSILMLWFGLSATTANEVYTAFDDASWAITSKQVGDVLGSHVKPLYEKFIDNCQKAVVHSNKNSPQVCSNDEVYRIKMNHDQPSSVYNYTKEGYAKIKAPKELFDLLSEFYRQNKNRAQTEWDHINTYHNMWDSPPTIAHLNQPKFRGGGTHLQSEIWKHVKPILEEWTGQKLSPVSLYGVRLYHNNSILAPHVDRMPLVTSCIINIDQDVEEDWPLEVYGHNGIATNVTMVPGDMVLYESHSVIHGRPFPLKGNYFANVFIHFEPIEPLDPNEPDRYDPLQDIPPYLMPNTPWEKEWRKNNPNGWKGVKHDPVVAATNGDIEVLKAIMRTDPKSLHKEDENGWRPLHEAVRSGELESVKLILLNGADKNHVTKTGVSPLNIAYEYLELGHPVIELLESLGAENISPEL